MVNKVLNSSNISGVVFRNIDNKHKKINNLIRL